MLTMPGLTANFFSTNLSHRLMLSFVILLSALTLVACGGGVTGDDKNYIIVKDQSVIHLDEVVVDSAIVEKDVLIVIYEGKASSALQNEKSNTVLGYVPLSAGSHENVVIKLKRPKTGNESLNNETLYAELRADNGVVGIFENDIDEVITQSSITAVSFGVIHSVDPYIEVSLDDAGVYIMPNLQQIILKKVISSGDSWLVFHRVNNGEPEQLLGSVKLNDGHHSQVSIPLNSTKSNKLSFADKDQLRVSLYSNGEPIVDDIF
ncbi:MAG: hypothetical protein OEX83_08870, partial [Gammaproteobacteria bacterium]|nr:hypothetical protein [Gammaproteobacteria bacterium]